jgi:hypothetical protein
MLEHAKEVAVMLLSLGALRTVTAIFHLQFMKAKPLGQLVQLRGIWIGDIKPRHAGQQLLG